MTGKPKPSYYYYADGKRVPLELDNTHLAINIGIVESAALRREATAFLESAKERDKSTRLRHEIHLVDREDVPGALRSRLENAGALQPVFRRGKALMVALPEVRLEVENRKEGSSIERMFRKEGPDVEIVHDQGARLTIRPTTGSGLDALHLANEVEETSRPLMAQVRFVRVVPRP